jgi:hypothetical protein
LGFIVEL